MAAKNIIGIDFGAYGSRVAVFKNDVIDVVANENGNRTTPSVVAYLDGGEVLVGDEALSQMPRNVPNTITNTKALIGMKYAEIENETYPFSVIQRKANDKGRNVAVEVEQGGKTKEISPEHVTSPIITKMKEIAEHSLGAKATTAVLAVPAYFTEEQTRALRDAAIHAGLNVLRILPEPVAVALAKIYDESAKKPTTAAAATTATATAAHVHQHKPKHRNMVVVDLGGTSLNVAVVGVECDLIDLKASCRDTTLGGGALDNLLTQHFVSDFTRKNRGKDLASNKRAMAKLRTACERAKKTLSTTGQASIEIDGLYEGQDYNGNVSRARFEDMLSAFSRNCLALLTKCIEDAKLAKADITDVIMVGGGARIPALQKALSNFFDGKEISTSVNPDEDIAMGAAYEGVVLKEVRTTGEKKEQGPVTVNVLPHNIGLERGDGHLAVVLAKGAVVPARKTVQVSTFEDNQTAVFLQVYEGEDLDAAKNNTLLGRFAISGIAPGPKADKNIKVKFEVDSTFNLHVTAEVEGKTPMKLSVTSSK